MTADPTRTMCATSSSGESKSNWKEKRRQCIFVSLFFLFRCLLLENVVRWRHIEGVIGGIVPLELRFLVWSSNGRWNVGRRSRPPARHTGSVSTELIGHRNRRKWRRIYGFRQRLVLVGLLEGRSSIRTRRLGSHMQLRLNSLQVLPRVILSCRD